MKPELEQLLNYNFSSTKETFSRVLYDVTHMSKMYNPGCSSYTIECMVEKYLNCTDEEVIIFTMLLENLCIRIDFELFPKYIDLMERTYKIFELSEE